MKTPLKIKTPCSEDWDKMTESDAGRFCQKCEKDVVDFRDMTSEEILQFFRQNTGKVCSRIKKGQLREFNRRYQELPSSSNILKYCYSDDKGKFNLKALKSIDSYIAPIFF